MIVLSGALVLPDRVLTPGRLVIDADRIVEIGPGVGASSNRYIVPGFIDVHVHGVDGVDTLDEKSQSNPVAAIAAALPRYGTTAFCPTTVACAPDTLARMLAHVRAARANPAPNAARVLAAHLESNFINPEFRGAQPLACLRLPRSAVAREPRSAGEQQFSATDVAAEIERGRDEIAIVTLAPELEGGLDLIRWLTARGHRVSLGHSGATYEQALDAIGSGARQATHLFNRMPPVGHRAPGLAGAVLRSGDIAAEIICDGYHVHPAVVHTTISAKGASRVMAITDGTALSGLRTGARGSLGGQPIVAGDSVALLPDGTFAGSMLTMDRAFRNLIADVRLSMVDAAAVCATTPARELGLTGLGSLVRDAVADVVVLDDKFAVAETYVAGQLAYSRS
jgi:N-acetylglucosamine-6-phosphate deacetylase